MSAIFLEPSNDPEGEPNCKCVKFSECVYTETEEPFDIRIVTVQLLNKEKKTDFYLLLLTQFNDIFRNQRNRVLVKKSLAAQT